MIKKILFAGILALSSVTSSAYAADTATQNVLQATPQLNKNCSGETIQSYRDQKSGKVSTLILTARHCIEGTDNADQVVEFPIYQNNKVVGRQEFIAKTYKVSLTKDLAILKLRDEQTVLDHVVKIAKDDFKVELGDDVITVGYPFGLALTLTKGNFGAVETIDFPKKGSEYFRATPMISGGSSGGGMYGKNEKGEYELLGITTLALGSISFAGFYTPNYEINEFIQTAIPGGLK